MAKTSQILPNIPKMSATPRPESLPYEPVCAVFRRYLHQAKLKFTPERAMILDAVLRKEGLFEPEGLIDYLKSLGHRVSRATVSNAARPAATSPVRTRRCACMSAASDWPYE